MAQSFYSQREGKAGDCHCVVTNEPWHDRVQVYLMNTKERKIANINKDGQIELSEMKEGVSKPLLTIPGYAWQSLLQALGNVEPDIKQEVVDAELKATKYHLEDMRKLVFEPEKVEFKEVK